MLRSRVTSLALRQLKCSRGGCLEGRWASRRWQSSYPGEKKGGPGFFTVLGSASLLGVGGALAYAKFDPEFRKTLEDSVPYASTALETVLGPAETLPPPPVKGRVIPPTTGIPASKDKQQLDLGIVKKRMLERENASKEKEKEPSKPAEKPSGPKRPSAEEQIAALSASLATLRSSTESVLETAISSLESAAQDTKHHTAHVLDALTTYAEEGGEKAWGLVKKASDAKKEAMQRAEAASQEATRKINDLREAVRKAASEEGTKGHQMLKDAEDFALAALQRLDEQRSKLGGAAAEADAAQRLHADLKKWTGELQKEVEAIHPGIKFGEGGQMSALEYSLLLGHAHKKINQLMVEMSKLQNQPFQVPYSDGVDTQHMVSDIRLEAELDRLRRDLEQDHIRKMVSQKEELENQLRHQLRHQAAAHADHLQDALRVQALELERRWTTMLDDEVRAERTNFHQTLGSLIARVKGLDNAIRCRADLDDAWRRAQRLWAACSALLLKLKTGKTEGSCWEEQLKPLKAEVEAVFEAAGPSNTYVMSVMNGIPSDATRRGVYPEDALKERFIKVDRICRRLALIDDSGGSLIRFFTSYMQSFFFLNAFERPPPNEIRDEPVPLDDLNTYQVLDRVRYSLDKDDLTQAVRYMHLLKGAPKVAGRDWLVEARLLLETRQAAEALVAHAAAVGVQAAL